MPSDSRHAVILAGGKGTRLAPYTTVLPKPLMPVDGMPILEVVLRQLRQHQFQRITICVGHLAELIMAFFGDGSKFGLNIEYSIEDEPLSTIGPLRLIENIDSPFLVMNGDILTDLSYSDLYDFHTSRNNHLTIATCKRHVDVSLGVLEYDAGYRITTFQEKPRLTYEASMGIYLMSPEIIERIPAEGPYGFDQLMVDLLAAGTPPAAHPFDGLWLDIGRREDFEAAGECLAQNRERFLGP